MISNTQKKNLNKLKRDLSSLEKKKDWLMLKKQESVLNKRQAERYETIDDEINDIKNYINCIENSGTEIGDEIQLVEKKVNIMSDFESYYHQYRPLSFKDIEEAAAALLADREINE